MLKNKYVAIILVIVAILAIANAVRILTGENKKNVPILQGPPVAEGSINDMPQPMPISNNTADSMQVKKVLKTPSEKISEKRNRIVSFYERLKDMRREILDPGELIWGRDPFGANEKMVSLERKKNIEFTDIFLSAIITKKEVKMCVINNIVFKEGEKKNGIYVSKIEDSNVILIANNREFKINIFERKSIPIIDKKNESGELK